LGALKIPLVLRVWLKAQGLSLRVIDNLDIYARTLNTHSVFLLTIALVCGTHDETTTTGDHHLMVCRRTEERITSDDYVMGSSMSRYVLPHRPTVHDVEKLPSATNTHLRGLTKHLIDSGFLPISVDVRPSCFVLGFTIQGRVNVRTTCETD
jgi:hypothetical protein